MGHRQRTQTISLLRQKKNMKSFAKLKKLNCETAMYQML
jgi:hypothetical protein